MPPDRTRPDGRRRGLTRHGRDATSDNLTTINDRARHEGNHPPARLDLVSEPRAEAGFVIAVSDAVSP
jgi:hypothetical protein